jgi:heme exporter protein D
MSWSVEDRYEPMPSLAGLPRWLWRRASPPVRFVAVGAVALAAIGLAAVAVTGISRRDEASREVASHRARAEERLRADQAPRHGSAPAGANLVVALEAAIDRDVRERLPRFGPPDTTCRRVHPVDASGRRLDVAATDAYFTCFAVQRTNETIAATLDTGYGFRAKADLAARSFAWCKLNPRPIHADQEEFIRVDLSRECVP